MKRLLAALLVYLLPIPFAAGASPFQPYAVTSYELTYEVVVRDLGPSDAFAIPLRVALLKSWEPHQFVRSISVNPQPDQRLEDNLGNSFATYQIERLQPGERFTVRVDASLTVNSIDYTVDPRSVGQSDKNDPNYSNFIVPTKFIQSDDPAVRSTAQQILVESSFLMDIVFKSYNWVIDNIDFKRLPGELGAAYAIRNREGDSAEFSNLLAALLRANQIPAQRISGWGGTFVQGGNYTANNVGHGWVEFYLPNYGWIPMDPTFGKAHRFDNFVKSDDKHIILTKGAGVHFFTRGLYETPFGEADVLTDYNIYVHKKGTEYVSSTGQLIITSFFVVPVVFFTFFMVRAKMRAKSRSLPSLATF